MTKKTRSGWLAIITVMIVTIALSFFLPRMIILNLSRQITGYGYTLSSVYEIYKEKIDDEMNDYDVSLTIYNNQIYFAWTETNGSYYGIRLGTLIKDIAITTNITPKHQTGFNGFSKVIAYNDKIYIVWVTITDRGDFDVVSCYYKYGDANVSNIVSLGFPFATYKVIELYPDMMVYNDTLYGVWSVRGKTTGGWYVSDILIQENNGTGWGNITDNLLPFNVRWAGYIDTVVYDNNPYIIFSSVNDTGHQNIATMILHKNQGIWNPYTYFITTTPFRKYDEYPSKKSIDFYPSTVVYKNKLYIFSSTNSETLTEGSDYDIVMRIVDKTGIVKTKEITNSENRGYDSAPYATVYDNKLFVAWTTNDTTITNDTDFDIVYRYYDGTKWSEIYELTPANDTGDDRCAKMIVYNDNLYFFWESNSTYTHGEDYDIVYRILSRVV